MLEAPRELLAWARLALEAPPEAPLKAPLPREELLWGTLRLPTWSPPPPRLALLAPPERDCVCMLEGRACACRLPEAPPDRA